MTRTLCTLAVLSFALCGFVRAQDAPDLEQQPTLPSPPPKAIRPHYGFSVWHDDYPVALELPAPNPAPLYVRSRRQALERVVANLQGNGRREVWLMATDFFGRAPDDAVEVLVEFMDRCFSQPGLVDAVRNSIEAMSRMGRAEFDDALRRAMEHPDGGVRQAAFAALATSGSASTVRTSASMFLTGMDGRARIAWLRAARLRLPDEVVSLYRHLMTPETPVALRDLVMQETVQLPPEKGAEVLETIWEFANGEFKSVCAGIMHSGGKTSGTLWLHNELTSDDAQVVVRALQQLKGREFGALREDVLRLSTHVRPEVRLGVAQALEGVDGEDVTRTYEVLSGTEELVETKIVALRELTRRGKPDAVTALIESASTATGTRLQLLLRLLGTSGDPRCIAMFRERFQEAPPQEGRQFLIAMALSRAPGSARALFEIFVGEKRPVSKTDSFGEQLDTVDYIPVILPNLRGQEPELLAMWKEIDKADYTRRALYLQALAGIAVERGDAEVAAPIVALLREILFDPSELPQLRIQALNSLTRSWLDLDDVRRLSRLQEPANKTEDAAVRAIAKDFLFEYF